MTHTIYGLRLKGDPEVRYVGVTYRGLKHRLRTHSIRLGQRLFNRMHVPAQLRLVSDKAEAA